MKIKNRIAVMLMTVTAMAGCQKDGERGAASRLIEGTEQETGQPAASMAQVRPREVCGVFLTLPNPYNPQFQENLALNLYAMTDGTAQANGQMTRVGTDSPTRVYPVTQTGPGYLYSSPSRGYVFLRETITGVISGRTVQNYNDYVLHFDYANKKVIDFQVYAGGRWISKPFRQDAFSSTLYQQ